MLEKLKEYKELIAIVVFFLGGFLWLQIHFPSKDELKPQFISIRCLLDNYMRLTQLQIARLDQEKEISEIDRRLSGAPGDDSGSGLSISPAMRMEIEQLKSDRKTRIDQLGQTTNEMVKINNDLARAICGKVEL